MGRRERWVDVRGVHHYYHSVLQYTTNNIPYVQYPSSITLFVQYTITFHVQYIEQRFRSKYIEQRFRSKVLRLSSVLITLLAAYLFIGFLLYPPSTFLVHFTGLGIIPNIVIMGLVCGLYSAFVSHGEWRCEGGGAHRRGAEHGDAGWCAGYCGAVHHQSGSMSLDPYQRHSFWLTLVFGFFFSLSTYGVNQSQTQRTFSTGSVQHAKRVIYYAIFGMLLLRFLINLAGVVIFAFYADCDPLTMGGVVKSNLRIVVVYVLQDLTSIPGLAGLFVASIYAAVLRL
ncbi:hypothetical protein HAZT_HAZT000119, partial [Hyalella azteca]